MAKETCTIWVVCMSLPGYISVIRAFKSEERAREYASILTGTGLEKSTFYFVNGVMLE